MDDSLVASLGLGSLADFGGPTPVHLPATNSPLLDSATSNCKPLDQRNESRSQPCDSGSVELSMEDAGIFLNGFESPTLNQY